VNEPFADTVDYIQTKFQEREALQIYINENPNMLFKKKEVLLARIENLNNTFDFTGYTDNQSYQTQDDTTSGGSNEYNINNFNVEYHESADVLEKDSGYGLDLKNMIIYDPENEKVVSAKVPTNQTSPIYYSPGKYKYGIQKYVPVYTDSVYLSPVKGVNSDTNIDAYDPTDSTFVPIDND
jgi:hypothetical protein